MQTKSQILDLLRLTTEVAQQSTELRKRAQEAISQSAVIMDSSRKLLSMWPVSGTPALPRREPGEPATTALGTTSSQGTPVTPATAEAALERVVEQDFAGEIVLLDGRHFVDCNLANCVLDYSGGPVVLEGTRFTGCRFRFGGEAAMTVSMLECFGLIGNDDAEYSKSLSRGSGSARVN